MRVSRRDALRWIVLGWIAAVSAPAIAAAAEDFTVVLLPDTQIYAENHPETYVAQTEWIKCRAAADNIKIVIHLGDLVQNADAEQEWKNADRAHRVLDGHVPYTVLPGNHDMTEDRQTLLYDKYFPPSRFDNLPFYGGHEGETNRNNYCFFTAAGMNFMVLSLEFAPAEPALQWADAVVAAHPDHRVILATHAYLGVGALAEEGLRIHSRFVRKHANVFLVVCGHNIGVNHQTNSNDAGGKVHEILCDYQGFPNGGDGWLQTLRFVPCENKIHVEAYSPLLKKYNRQPGHAYTLEYVMSAGSPCSCLTPYRARCSTRASGFRVGSRRPAAGRGRRGRGRCRPGSRPPY